MQGPHLCATRCSRLWENRYREKAHTFAAAKVQQKNDICKRKRKKEPKRASFSLLIASGYAGLLQPCCIIFIIF